MSKLNQSSKVFGLSDYHIHPNYSKDANGTLKEYCKRALELGLSEICFTTHYDTDPKRKDIDFFFRIQGKLIPSTPEIVKQYIKDIREISRKYAPLGLRVKVGLEAEYAIHIEESLRKNLSLFDLDYVLGAVHCLDHIAITSSAEAEEYFRTKTPEELCKQYYHIVQKAGESKLFHAIAHLDTYKKYGLGFYGEQILTAHREFIKPALESLAQNQVGIEINTGVLRKGHTEFSPSLEILEYAQRMGVKVVAIGSDAHHIEHLGADLDKAAPFAKHLFPHLKRIDVQK